jgi:ribonuclease T
MEMHERFRGYLPVPVDLETGGFDNQNNPILEIACSFVTLADGILSISSQHQWIVTPFQGSTVEPASLKITGIDLDDPMRNGMTERDALQAFFVQVRREMKRANCHRAILVAHNASFDHGFIKAACARSDIKRNPFHPFSTIDTVALSAVSFGHTVLSETCRRAGLEFDEAKAHGAAYDADRTAELFCQIVNMWGVLPAGTQQNPSIEATEPSSSEAAPKGT